MKKQTKTQTTKQQQRTTLIYAVATFLGLSVLTVVAWAVTRPDAPAPVQAASAIAAPAQTQVPAPAEHDHSHDFETISIEETKALYDKGEIAILDVRSMEQYTAAHIPNAMQIPLTRVEGEIPYLKRDKLIVTYCTCPAEESSGEAALILARGGIKAKALKGGLDAWINAGYATATGLQ